MKLEPCVSPGWWLTRHYNHQGHLPVAHELLPHLRLSDSPSCVRPGSHGCGNFQVFFRAVGTLPLTSSEGTHGSILSSTSTSFCSKCPHINARQSAVAPARVLSNCSSLRALSASCFSSWQCRLQFSSSCSSSPAQCCCSSNWAWVSLAAEHACSSSVSSLASLSFNCAVSIITFQRVVWGRQGSLCPPKVPWKSLLDIWSRMLAMAANCNTLGLGG